MNPTQILGGSNEVYYTPLMPIQKNLENLEKILKNFKI